MSLGWIRLHRKIREHWLWPVSSGKKKRRYSEFEAWVDLLLSANHKRTKLLVGQTLVTVERGRILTSQIGLAKRWGWNRKRVVAFLSVLKKDENLDIQTTVRGDNGYTILSIRNYGKYQDVEGGTMDNQLDGQRDKLGTFSGHSRDIYNNVENEKKKDTSGKPDSNPFSSIAEKTIRQLNQLSGKSYRPGSKDVNKYLIARLKDGATEADVLAVVEDRWRRWGDNPDMREHFNPVTLFRPTNFEKYLTEARDASRNGAQPKEVRREGGMVFLEDGSSVTVGAFERRNEVDRERAG